MMKAILLLSLLLPLVVTGQEKLPPKYLRLVPLGELPPWKEEIRGDRRIQSPPEPGQMPPSKIRVNGGDLNGFGGNLFLRRITNYYSIAGKQQRLEILEEGENPPWISHAMPTASHTLAILFRDLQEMTWLKPVVKIVRDDLQAFPLGSMRLVNVSHLEIAVKVGDQDPVFIKSGESSQQKLKEGKNLVRVDVIDPDGSNKMIFQNDFSIRKGQRVQSFVFKSQGLGASRPVRFTYEVDRFQDPQSLFKSQPPPAVEAEIAPAGTEGS